MENTKKPFKILALDGGGIRGAISARILQEVEEKLQEKFQNPDFKLNQYFDMISGTSTGSILAAGVACGMSGKDLQQVYLDRGEKIFPYQSYNSLKRLPFVLQYKWSNLKDGFNGIVEDFSHNQSPWANPTRRKQLFSIFKRCPKFSHQGLIEVLKENLKDQENSKYIKIRDIKDSKLLILAYDTFYRNTTFFTNYHAPEEHRWFDDMELWQICTSSSSAPTFFPPYEFKYKENADAPEWTFPHVDGGVSANNPALAAISHAMLVGKHKIEDISVLSIGTGKTTDPYEYEQVKSWGILDWAQQIPNVFMGGQDQISHGVCRQIIKSVNPKGYLRIQFDLNQRFDPNIAPGSPRRMLPKNKQTNEFTKTKISEAIDDGRRENVQNLIDTTAAFITKSKDYTSDENGNRISLQQAIENFINNNV